MVEIPHQRGPRLRPGDVSRRAAHVDVDDGGAGRFGDPRALTHPARFAPRELHHVGIEATPLRPQQRVGTALGQRLARGHLGDNQPGAKIGDHSPKRRIGHA